MIESDVQELKEVVELILNEPEAKQGVVANLSTGNFVVIPEELFIEITANLNSINLEEEE